MILMYEDEEQYIDEYIFFIKDAGYKLNVIGKADNILDLVKTSYDVIQLFIIDIMVYGPGNSFPTKEPQDGRNNGIYLLEEIEKIERLNNYKKIKPKIIFTNKTGIDIKDIKNRFKSVNHVIQKSYILPSELVEIIKSEI